MFDDHFRGGIHPIDVMVQTHRLISPGAIGQARSAINSYSHSLSGTGLL